MASQYFKMIRTFSMVTILHIISLYAHVSNSSEDYHNNEERRQILVKDIINKLTNLSLFSFYNTSIEDRPLIMDKIKNKLKLVSKFTGSRRDKYVELVMEGIQSIVAKKRISEIEESTDENSIIEANVQNENEIDPTTRSYNALRTRAGSNIKIDDFINSLELEGDATGIREDPCDCSCIEGKLCSKISSLSQFTCHKDQKAIPLTKLCDGKFNCQDKSDEDRCRIHANKKLSDAKLLINEIKSLLPKRCLEVQSITDKVVMNTHEESFANVLKRQLKYLNIVSPIKFQKKILKPIKEVNEIATIVSSVGAALEGALCIRRKIYKEVSNRKSGMSLNEDVVFKQQRTWLPSFCTCVDQFCDQTNCSSACDNTCWQRYSLGQWICKTINGARSVSLDLVCDGKVDCLDQSDENDCTSGAGADKFVATQMYNIILEVLSTKTASAEFYHLLNKFIKLQEAVRSLQAQTIIEETNAPAVKRWRDEVIAGLLSIYEGILVKANNIEEVDSGYHFLMSVSHQLVDAMKRSKTGNERIAPSNNCHCVGDKCTLAECSEACILSCAVKSSLTEYSCRNTSGTIPIQNICNGKNDCPEGDDEERCRNDVCRNHHLVVLRNKIQNYKDDSWGNMLGDILETWKTKTITTIRVIEKMDRVHRLALQKLVGETLHDLVQTYARHPKLTRKSPSTGSTYQAFLDLCRLIQDTLRECTH